MELLPYREEDQWLTEALECDPVMMKELGGPIPREAIPDLHRRRVAAAARDDWWFTIVPDPSSGPVGTIGIWPSTWQGAPIHETGWMILPQHQGRGLASAALRLLLDRARRAGPFRQIHAFPGRTNAASNALCQKAGFRLLEECEVEFRDRTLSCNHWVLSLPPSGA